MCRPTRSVEPAMGSDRSRSESYGDSDAFAPPVVIPRGASFTDMVALKGKPDIGDKINGSEEAETRPWDAAALLETDADVVAYLDAVLDEDDPVLLAAALGDVARAKGMTRIAQATGLGRESLYKALSLDGNPAFATVHKVVRALGLRLRVSV